MRLGAHKLHIEQDDMFLYMYVTLTGRSQKIENVYTVILLNVKMKFHVVMKYTYVVFIDMSSVIQYVPNVHCFLNMIKTMQLRKLLLHELL